MKGREGNVIFAKAVKLDIVAQRLLLVERGMFSTFPSPLPLVLAFYLVLGKRFISRIGPGPKIGGWGSCTYLLLVVNVFWGSTLYSW